MNRIPTTLVAGLAVAGALSLTACDDLESAEQTVETDARKVEQELHDDVVAAYDEAAGFVSTAEGDISDAGRGAWDEITSDFAAIETRLDGAADKVGEEAEREYREIQHEVQSLIRRTDDFLHGIGHELEDVEHAAWSGLKEGYHDVADFIDHVVDRLH